MKIAVINETSAADKNKDIIRALEGFGHTVLNCGMKEKGEYTVIWDGKDASGISAASGIYFYRMTIGKFAETRKMLLLK